MKKLLVGLFLFLLLAIGTQVYAAEEGCPAGQNYSLITGQKCGCSHDEVYSSTTGQACPATTPATCSGFDTLACTVQNGIGTGFVSRTCNEGAWGPYNACNVTSCNTGYKISGDSIPGSMASNSCVLDSTTTPPTTEDGCSSGGIYSDTTGQECPRVVAPVTYTDDLTPRISYWYGKVNQHVSIREKMWQTDPDGVSGANIDKLSYCKKWYPNTTSVIEYKTETIKAWHDNGNVNDYQSTKMSYLCTESTVDIGCISGGIYSDTTGQRCSNPSITVLSPNGGEAIKLGDTVKITWKSFNLNNPTDTVLLFLKDSSSFCPDEKTGCSLTASSMPNTGSYLWDTNSKMSIGEGRNISVRPGSINKIVACVNNLCDESDNYFTINSSIDNGCSSGQVYSSTTGQKCPGSNTLIISGVSGPQSLNVNQTGTWTITASSSTGGNLSYSVKWGDEVYSLSAMSTSQSSISTQQSAIFTHTYSQAGTYIPTFTVTSENTIRCITTPCPGNEGSASTSLSVKVGQIPVVLPAGCTSTLGYSPITGIKCDSSQGSGDGCQPGFNFSPITGARCPQIDEANQGASVTVTNPSTTNTTSSNSGTFTLIRRTLKKGIKGDDVKILQLFLNLTADGSFGPETQRKVMEWQIANGLTPDGAFGIQSATKAGLSN